MRFRRNRADSAADATPDDGELVPGTDDGDNDLTESGIPEDEDDVASEDESSASGSKSAGEDDEPADEDDSEPEDQEFDDPEPTGRFGWLRPRKKKIDYGPDFTVTVATLPDLERFPEDGHVPPEIVRSWMALQQFGEAMLLVSWIDRSPAGYVLVSWTGDWDDDVRREHPNVPALCNLWADEKYVAEDVEVKLIEAAIKVCSKQGRSSLIATIESTNTKVRGELEELGFEKTGMTTSEKFVYRDAEGRKRRGAYQNLVLLKKL